MAMVDCSEMISYSSRGDSITVSNKDTASTSIKMVIISKEHTSKMRKEDMDVTTLAKEGFSNHNLTLCLLKFQR